MFGNSRRFSGERERGFSQKSRLSQPWWGYCAAGGVYPLLVKVTVSRLSSGMV